MARPLEIVIPPKGGLRVGSQGSRHLIPLEGFGSNPNAMYRPLKVCQGDCDEDADCKGDLVCFQRDPGDPVPGCEGGEEAMSKTDFCIENPQNQRQQPSKSEDEPVVIDSVSEDEKSSTPQEKSAVVETNAAVQKKSSGGSDLPIVVGYGSSPDQVLKECEGDCDSDSDCQGSLVCFQRDAGQEVPGCNGISLSKSDFCVKGTKSSNFAAVSDEQESEQESDPLQNKLIVAAIISAAVLLAVCLTCMTCRFLRARDRKCCLDK